MASARGGVVVLLPPSEGKRPGGSGDPWDPAAGEFSKLAKPRKQIARALAAAARSRSVDHAKLFGVKDVTQARDDARALLSSPTARALDRYTGVLYDALDVTSLTADERSQVEARTVIISALAGVVGAGEALPDYKLPIAAILPSIGGLSAFWRPHITPVLNSRTADAIVWDLLPGAHAAAWTPGATWTRRWIVTVVREDAMGKRTTVSHDNKSTKGAFARAVLTRDVTDPRELIDWAAGRDLSVEVDDDVVRLVRR